MLLYLCNNCKQISDKSLADFFEQSLRKLLCVCARVRMWARVCMTTPRTFALLFSYKRIQTSSFVVNAHYAGLFEISIST